MSQHQQYTKQRLETKEKLPYFDGVCFNPDTNTIYGNYSDEISAYRAKRHWQESLKLNFQLEEKYDYATSVNHSDKGTFILTCKFRTATARYAFWKITNNQAPEAQYVIETAHIPVCDERYEEILKAPDLRSIYDLPLVLNPNKDVKAPSTLSHIIKKVLDANKK